MNKYKLLILFLFILIPILISFILFTRQNTNNSNLERNYNDKVIPDPKIENEESLKITYKLQNEKAFEISTIKDFNFDYCNNRAIEPKIPVEIVNYRFKNEHEVLGQTGVTVFKNMSSNLNVSDIKKSYDLYNEILQDKYDFKANIDLLSLNLGIKPCTGFGGISFLEEFKFKFSNTSDSYLLIFYGSTQSLVNSQYFPLSPYLISKVGDDYAKSYFNLDYSSITKSNNLISCEKKIGENKFINTFEKETRQCIENSFRIDFEKSKLDKIFEEYNELYKLEK